MEQYILPALIGALPALALLFWQGRKLKAETEQAKAESADIISGASIKLIEPMGKRISELEARVQELENQLEKQEKLLLTVLNGAARLQGQVQETGAEPVFIVPAYKPLKKRKYARASAKPHSS
jgi:chromosome segregation ATPase